LIAGGQPVIVADHGPTKAREFAEASNGNARAASVAATIDEADVIILAVYFDAIKGLLAHGKGTDEVRTLVARLREQQTHSQRLTR